MFRDRKRRMISGYKLYKIMSGFNINIRINIGLPVLIKWRILKWYMKYRRNKLTKED